jgi:hypothetical protein
MTPCNLTQLAVTFDGGGEGAGNQLGLLTLWNVGPTICVLDAPVGLVALAASGRPLPQVAPMQSAPASPPLVLPARTPAPGADVQPGDGPVGAAISIRGEYRDDPYAPDGMCTTAHEVRPASWKVYIGKTSITVPNTSTNPMTGINGIEGCRGAIAAEPQSRY